jgi:uncharacterized Fe-S cluster protein YjdI
MNPNDREYTNGEITVYWKPAKCIHATTCFRDLIEVFNPRNRPWINMQGAPTKKIIKVVDKCPTQAIAWKYNKDIKDSSIKSSPELPEITPEDIIPAQSSESVSISLIKNGPILVDGDFKIVDSTGAELKSKLMTSFCRCGHSKSQPYCDGSHRNIGFKS